MYAFGWGGVGGEVGEWMGGLGLGFINPVRTVLDVCLCLGCGGVGGVGGEYVGDWTRVCRGIVVLRCESGSSV